MVGRVSGETHMLRQIEIIQKSKKGRNMRVLRTINVKIKITGNKDFTSDHSNFF